MEHIIKELNKIFDTPEKRAQIPTIRENVNSTLEWMKKEGLEKAKLEKQVESLMEDLGIPND